MAKRHRHSWLKHFAPYVCANGDCGVALDPRTRRYFVDDGGFTDDGGYSGRWVSRAPACVALLALIALAACAVDERAHVRVVVAVDAPELAEYVDGANAWSQLGYLASFDATGLPECADVRDAFDGACEVVVYVARGLVIENFGAAGVTARDNEGRRVSQLDVRYTGLELVALAAHELGHSLLDTHEHVADSRAVMFHASSNWTPQPDDYALACSSIGVCR